MGIILVSWYMCSVAYQESMNNEHVFIGVCRSVVVALVV